MLTKQFRKAHDESLTDHFFSFYDDISEYGNVLLQKAFSERSEEAACDGLSNRKTVK